MGNTIFNWANGTNSQDHPYIRGEYKDDELTITQDVGSSLHTWGIPDKLGTFDPFTRIIPTYVGNTTRAPRHQRPARDHPYIRGEYKQIAISLKRTGGSSLHTWGIPQIMNQTTTIQRIIPTYVGNTRKGSVRTVKRQDHPYIRGEYSIFPGTGILNFRIIPTYVGNTPEHSPTEHCPQDHPYIRGEYTYPHPQDSSTQGSSLHTWGIPTGHC